MVNDRKSWDQCDEFARHLADDGKERVVFCDQGKHAAPGDSSEWHHDPDLDIYWKFAEDFYSDEDG
jgi:hypothetical protein